MSEIRPRCAVPLLLVLVTLMATGAEAGTVRMDGTAVRFDARAGEANRLVFRPGTRLVDPRTGESRTGVEVEDSGASLILSAGCRGFLGRVLCEGEVTVLVVRLGDRDDTVRQENLVGGPVVPMFVQGGPGDDRITGSDLGDLLEGGDGDDEIEGRNGNDTLSGGFGHDRLDGGAGDDRLLGYFGDDELHGGLGNDELRGQAGTDLLVGGADVDRFFGGPGPDRMLARDAVAETVDCGAGNDTAELDAVDTASGC